MAYPAGYWAEFVRSNSSSSLVEHAAGNFLWLRTSDGEPLEQEVTATGGRPWFAVGADTDEPDYLGYRVAGNPPRNRWRARKTGEAWLPSENGQQISTIPWNGRATYRFFEQAPPEVAPSFTDDTGDPISGTQGTAITSVTVPEANGSPAPTYAVVGSLPTGVSFDPATREISFDEDAIQPGSGTIRIRATNNVGTKGYDAGYWAELVRSSSNGSLVESTTGSFVWLRTSDGEPLEQELSTRNGPWVAETSDTREPDLLLRLAGRDSFRFRFRKTGEAWIPTENGINANGVSWNGASTHRFFTSTPSTADWTVAYNFASSLPDAVAPTVAINAIPAGDEGTTVRLSAAVTGGTGDAFDYAWAVTGGALDSSTATSPTLTRPAVASDRDFEARLIVTARGTGTVAKDGTSAASTRATRTFRVRNVAPNVPPSATIATAAQTVDAGGTLQLAASDNDSDGTIATRAWIATGGSFVDAAIQDAVWRVPYPTSQTSYTLTYAVTDDDGTSDSDTVVITVRAVPLAEEDLFVCAIDTDRIYLRSGGYGGASWDSGITLPSGVGVPTAIAFDSNGDLYLSDNGTDRIYKRTGGYAGGTWDAGIAPPSGVTGLSGIAFDSQDRLYLSDFITDRVYRKEAYDSGNWDAGISLPTSATHPTGVAVDSKDNVYICDNNGRRIYRRGDYSSGTWDSGITLPAGAVVRDITFDSNDDLFYVTQASARIYRKPGGYAGGDWDSGIAPPVGVGAPAGIAILGVIPNVPPTASITTVAQTIDSGDILQLAASDSDSDGTIATRAWTATGGSFVDAAIQDAQWKAPRPLVETKYTLTYKVTDDGGASASASVIITVRATPTTEPTFPQTIGCAGTRTASTIRWEDDGTVYAIIPSSLTPSGVGQLDLRRLSIELSGNTTVFRLQTAVRGDTGTSGTPGQDLSDNWEKFGSAIGITIDNKWFEFPGPNVAGLDYVLRDTSEPYTYSIRSASVAAEVRRFNTAYRALTIEQCNATQLTLQDESSGATADKALQVNASLSKAIAEVEAIGRPLLINAELSNAIADVEVHGEPLQTDTSLSRAIVEVEAIAEALRVNTILGRASAVEGPFPDGPLKVDTSLGRVIIEVEAIGQPLSVDAFLRSIRAHEEIIPDGPLKVDASLSDIIIDVEAVGQPLRIDALLGRASTDADAHGRPLIVVASLSRVDISVAQSWIGDLPFEFLRRGYTQNPVPNIIPFRPDKGKTIRRRRFTKDAIHFGGNLLMTTEQWNIFKNFYNNTTKAGSNPFTFPAPPTIQDKGDIEVMFRRPPSRIPYGTKWLVNLQLRTLI